ncbi:Response regulator containing CheY-like receiver domain and AraC-type DNA-binding domain [Leuconostoc citreum LBAE C10]|uniref:helix-turn-helix domain-containing protein n=1 Tax=Leuconostoc citreum TaxID=33964 RepID=UPI0002465E77|nr:helix-turn-helix domain-containing protein [Leuconostoc citreum]CCF25439.1 Response regulator containing CheY-like receiver domain and AraC-type DNA-binding domain [Leuconostoc citreum LBAE C10]
MSTLTNLKSIAQIIYTLKTSRSAPDETLHLQHISKVDKNGMIIKFDSTAYYKVEKDIIQAIIYSHQNDLINALERISQINLFNVQNDSCTTSRLEKNYLISYIAILNRAVIQWGYPVSLAFKVHHELMKELESIKKIPTFSQVLQGITWYYFQTIKEYRTTNFLPLHLRIKSYINEHIGENITLNDIASALHASKKTLNPAFKKEYKLTITQFIRQRKIAVAKELLIACESSTIEISELLSFSSQSYFIKTFKDLTGTTPQYFREHFFDQHLHL